MSGRSRPSAVVVVCCSSKSQCSAMPAAFTALRSVISPQRPRVCGDRSAVTRFLVSFCSCSWPTCSAATRSFNVAYAPWRSASMSRKPALVAGQGLAQRVEQLRDRLLALREVALGGRADLVELGIGQGEELLVVLGQRLRRQLRERAGEQPALLLRPARRLRFGRARAARARRRRRRGPSRPPRPHPTSTCSWAASSRRPALRIGQAALRPGGRRRPYGSAGPGARQRRWRGRRQAR